MQRYRVFMHDFDSSANLIGLEIDESWDNHVKKQNLENKQKAIESFVNQYGTLASEAKLANFLEFGNIPPNIIAYHNNFLRQIRDAFTVGAYYPALTGATALGERILNYLFHSLKGYFKDTKEYKKHYDKGSIPDWKVAINILTKWEILLPSVINSFNILADIRNKKAIHFNPDTDQNARQYALEAIRALLAIIRQQFSAFGPEPWFIPGTLGASFIKKEAESWPFVKVFYIQNYPNCALVSPFHKLEVQATSQGLFYDVVDPHLEDSQEITDLEFVELYNNRTT